MAGTNQREALARFLDQNQLAPGQLNWGRRVIVFTMRRGPEILEQGIFFRFTREWQKDDKVGIVLGLIPEPENEVGFGDHLDSISRFATDSTTNLILPSHLVEDRQQGERRIITMQDDFLIADGEAYAIWSGRRNLAVRLWRER